MTVSLPDVSIILYDIRIGCDLKLLPDLKAKPHSGFVEPELERSGGAHRLNFDSNGEGLLGVSDDSVVFYTRRHQERGLSPLSRR